jgi:antitoxin component of MazEF toxin-antitoxin module
MMTTIISIGNSKGIRIPKLFLDESGLDNEVELEVKKGEIKIVPAKIKRNMINDTLLLSEKSLGTDWNRPQEDEAWKNLQ